MPRRSSGEKRVPAGDGQRGPRRAEVARDADASLVERDRVPLLEPPVLPRDLRGGGRAAVERFAERDERGRRRLRRHRQDRVERLIGSELDPAEHFERALCLRQLELRKLEDLAALVGDDDAGLLLAVGGRTEERHAPVGERNESIDARPRDVPLSAGERHGLEGPVGLQRAERLLGCVSRAAPVQDEAPHAAARRFEEVRYVDVERPQAERPRERERLERLVRARQEALGAAGADHAIVALVLDEVRHRAMREVHARQQSPALHHRRGPSLDEDSLLHRLPERIDHRLLDPPERRRVLDRIGRIAAGGARREVHRRVPVEPVPHADLAPRANHPRRFGHVVRRRLCQRAKGPSRVRRRFAADGPEVDHAVAHAPERDLAHRQLRPACGRRQLRARLRIQQERVTGVARPPHGQKARALSEPPDGLLQRGEDRGPPERAVEAVDRLGSAPDEAISRRRRNEHHLPERLGRRNSLGVHRTVGADERAPSSEQHELPLGKERAAHRRAAHRHPRGLRRVLRGEGGRLRRRRRSGLRRRHHRRLRARAREQGRPRRRRPPQTEPPLDSHGL